MLPLTVPCPILSDNHARTALPNLLSSAERDPYRVTYFVIQYFFIVVAPVFLSAALYAVLASLVSRAHRLRLLHFHPTSNHNSISNGNNGNGTAGDVGHPTRTSKWLLRPVATVLNRPRLLVSTFIVADLIATTLQVGGAAGIGAAESNGKDPKLANNILLAGLAFQVACFALFALLYIIAASLISATIRKLSSTTMTMGTIPDSGQMVENGSAPKDERRNSLPSVEIMQEHRPVAVPSGLRTFMPVIGLAAALIYLRTIFRLIETAQGVFGYLSTHEAFFATLEFVPICLAVLILAFWHPSRYLPSV